MPAPRVLRTGSFRLAALYALLFALSTGLLFGIVYWIASDVLFAQARLSIDGEMAVLTAADPAHRPALLAARIAGPDARDFYYGLQDATGRLLGGNLPVLPTAAGWQDLVLQDMPARPDAADPADRRDEDETVLLARVDRLGGGGLVTVAMDSFRITEAQEAIMRAFGWAAAAGLTLALLGGVLLSRGFLRRIDDLNRATRGIMAGRLSERIPVGTAGDELDELAQNLNEMLDRLQASMAGLRQVSDDIAHDLRTPLSRLRQGLEAVHRDGATRADYEQAVGVALDHADEALATFGALLRIAQIESGSRRAQFADVELSFLLEQLAMTYAGVAEDLGRTLTARIAPDLRQQGDRELLTQLFVNLIENALRHTPAGAKVELVLERGPTGPVARIADDGPGIPEADRQIVLRRFHRLDRSRSTPGNGLGLALVAAVAALHGVALHLGDNRPGLVVSLHFPPQPAAPS